MTFRAFLIITAIVSFAFGLGFLLAPQMMSAMYGVPYSPSVAMLDHFFGSALFGLGLFAFALKDVADTTLIPKLLVAHGVHDAIGCVVAIHATLTHAINALGWGSVFVYGALAVGCVVLYREYSGGTYKAA